MASGERGAQNTKAWFAQFTHGAEDLRRNINSYADGIMSGTHSNTADNYRDDHSTDYTSHSQATGTMGATETERNSGWSKDSQRAGDMIKNGATNLERKFREKQARRH